MIGVLGASGVGKTVYLGMLMDMLSRQPEPFQVLARGAFSITVQQTTTESLSRCEFPAKTPNEPDRWNWVHCLVSHAGRRRGLEMVMPDMAGESILEEIDHPNSYPVISAMLKKCSGVIVLVDAIKLQDGKHDQEHFVLKLLSFLNELCKDSKHDWSRRPISLVFSKADQCENCFDDPTDFARQHAPGVWKQCRERFKHVSYFACGVAGACAYRTVFPHHRQAVPLRVEPRGICEPFIWMVDSLRGVRRN
jgi:hypothetical protein